MKNGRNRQEGKSWFILLVTAVMLSMSILVGAETVTWNNVSGGLWNAYTNWTPIGVPVPGDNVVVNNAGANTVLLNSAATINTITIADDSNLTLGSGQLTLTSAIPTVLYNLTITKAGDGSGTVKSLPAVINCGTSCNSVFEKGSIVTLTANPSVSSLFNGWTGGDCSGTDVCYATMNADTNILATFTSVVPDSDQVMKVNLLINKAHTDLYPELLDEVLVKAIFDDMNAVLAKDPQSKRKVVFNKLIVYQDADFNTTTDNVSGNPAYYADNNFVSNPNFGGATILLWYYTGAGQLSKDVLPKFFADAGGGTGYSNPCYVNGKTYTTTYVAALSSGDCLLVLRNTAPTYDNGFSQHDAAIGTLLHELIGHGTTGIGHPENYGNKIPIDLSGTLPDLGGYDYSAKTPTDPMGSMAINQYDIREVKFSDLHYYWIRNNPTALIDKYAISNVRDMTFKVKVQDALGNPVSGATVLVYGGIAVNPISSLGINMGFASMIQTATITDANGFATVNNDFNTAWFVKGVKAYSGAKLGGVVMDILDALKVRHLDNSNEYLMTITIATP